MAITIQLTGDLSQLEATLNQMQGLIDRRLSAVESRLHAGERATQQFSDRSRRHLESLQRSYDQVARTVSRVLGVLASIGVTVSFAAIIKGAIDTAAGFEQLDTQLRFVVGSLEAFQRARQFILQFTAQTPFQLGEVSKAFIDLTRRGLDVERILKGVADAASLQRFPSQAFDRIIFAIGQIADRGKLAQQELNQLSEAGISTARVRQELAELGVTITDDIGSANISAAKGIEAIIRVLEKDFKDAMLATAGNWTTMVSNVQDTWSILVDTITRGPLFDFLKGLTLLLLDEMTKAIQEDEAAFRAFGTTAVAMLKEVMAWVARVLDLLVKLDEAFAFINRTTAAANAAISNYATSRASEALDALSKGLEFALAPPATVDALKRAADAVKNYGKAAQEGTGLAQKGFAALGATLEGPYTAALQQALTQSDALLQASNAKRDQIFAENEKRVAEQRKRLEALALGGGAAGGADAAQAAANAAKAQEQVIQQSLKRQEALIAQSFDQRRADADAFFAEQIRKAPGEAEEIQKARTANLRLLAQEEATLLEDVRLDSNDKLLAATVDQLNKEKAAHAGKVAEIAKIEAALLATYEEHGARQEEIFAKTATVRQRLSKEATDEEIKQILREQEILEKSRQQGLEDFARQTREMRNQQEREQRQMLANQLRNYQQFVTRVADYLSDIFVQLLDGTLNALDTFKRLFTQALASLASSVIAPFIAAIGAGIAGSIASVLPSTMGQMITQFLGVPAGIPTGGNPLQTSGMVAGIGLQFSSLFGPQSLLGGAVGFLTDSLNFAANSVAQFFGSTAFPAGFVGPLPAGAAQVSTLGALGGIAGIGGGLYNAFTAEGLGGQIGGGIGAAAGSAALAASLGLVAIPGLQPVALALAALAPLIGNLIDTLGAPRGPRFVLGDLGGLGVGLSGGDLSLTGALTTGRTRAERLPGGADADAIQSAMEAGIEQAIAAMVATINQVAVDPATLLIPAQEALNTGLRNALIVNSASAENFQRDIEAQLKAVAVQLAVNFLGPLSDAVRQLESQDVAAQIQRLPEVVGIAAQQWQALARAVDDLVATGQTDVSNIIPQLRDQLATFQRRMIDTAVTVSGQIVDAVIETSTDALEQIRGRTALVQALSIPALFTQPLSAVASLKGAQAQLEAVGINDTQGIQDQLSRLVGDILTNALILISDAMSQGSDSFAEMLQVILAIPPAVMALNPVFAQFQAQAQAFATVLSPLLQNIAQLEAALLPVDERVADLALTIADLHSAIAEAGDNLTLALPLYDQLRQAIMLDLQLKSEQVQAQVTLIQEQESLIATQEQLIQAQEQLLRQAEDMVLSIHAAIRQQSAPAASADSILADLTALQAELAGQTGAEALDTISEMQALLMEAQQLGQSTNNLELVRIANELLASLIPMTEQAVAEADQQISAAEQQIAQAQQQITLAEQQLIALTGTADATEALRVIQEQALAQLQMLNAQLYALFQQTSPFQSGGWVHRATGGLIPTMLEPGEGVFTGPMSGAQQTALVAMNQAFPRFAGGGLVPGSGEGDTVPALVPAGSFVLNRSAATVLQGPRGFQAGGVVTGPVVGGTVVHRTEIHLHGVTIRSDQDLRALADELDRLAARRTRRSTGGGR